MEEEKIIERFAKNLKELRESVPKYKRNAKQLAKDLGISKQAISNYENGKHYPRIEYIIKLTQLLNCKMEDLLQPLFRNDNDSSELINRIRKICSLPEAKVKLQDNIDTIEKAYNLTKNRKRKKKIT